MRSIVEINLNKILMKKFLQFVTPSLSSGYSFFTNYVVDRKQLIAHQISVIQGDSGIDVQTTYNVI